MIPILKPTDISKIMSYKSPRCLGSHVLALKDTSLSEVMVTAMAQTLPFILTYHKEQSFARSALLWNLSAAILGHTNGQSQEVLSLLTKVPNVVKERILASQTRELHNSTMLPGASSVHKSHGSSKLHRASQSKIDSDDGKVLSKAPRHSQESATVRRPQSYQDSQLVPFVEIYPMNFTDVIYANRKQLKQFQLMSDNRLWPETVSVMDKSYKLTGIYYDPILDTPASIYGWAEFQFRSLSTITVTVNEIIQCLRLWWGIYEQVTHYLVTHGLHDKSNPVLVFNTVWALLGYIQDQDETALDLAARMMADADFESTPAIRAIPSPTAKPPAPYVPPANRKPPRVMPPRKPTNAKESTETRPEPGPERTSKVLSHSPVPRRHRPAK